jgi:hypothetical protein
MSKVEAEAVYVAVDENRRPIPIKAVDNPRVEVAR